MGCLGCWCLLPLSLFAVSLAGTWAVYGLALANQHVCPLDNWSYNISCSVNISERCCTEQNMPFISTSGLNAPESSLFSATLNLGAILFLAFCVLRHAQVIETNEDKRVLSKMGLAFGCLSSVGGFITGNCSPNSLMVLHYFGAALGFLCSSLYTIVQTILTYKCFITGWEFVLAPIRVVLTTIQIMAAVVYLIFFVQTALYRKHFAAISEWVLCTNLQLFVGTFAIEFFFFSSSAIYVLCTGKRNEEKTSILSHSSDIAMFSK
ncbi:transmembrane protein 150A [Latimeria chalumnae]|uniref:transmembrane protein 150A n=1 Tax=Latimeria chalumnae TaxID=7897 RepID=UPI0003C112E8|nr:PREDICTED: transmembrane protein 150A-like [Latimeria chalumnae]|eukprot:XP_005990021.1 PREDICTED: transmembrane protein 150A-like [Latimeria chalumnae]